MFSKLEIWSRALSFIKRTSSVVCVNCRFRELQILSPRSRLLNDLDVLISSKSRSRGNGSEQFSFAAISCVVSSSLKGCWLNTKPSESEKAGPSCNPSERLKALTTF